MTRRIAVVSAGLGRPSTTRLLADLLTDAADRALRLREEEASVEVIELRGLAHQVTDSMLTGFPPPELAAALRTVGQADGLVAVTPVFSASYSGLFKSFFDILEEGALQGKPVLLGATAGTARHSLVLDQAMRPLFAYLRALIVPTAVFGAAEDFGSNASGSLTERAELAGRELADLVVGRQTSGPVDPFDNPTPFEQLLTGGEHAGR